MIHNGKLEQELDFNNASFILIGNLKISLLRIKTSKSKGTLSLTFFSASSDVFHGFILLLGHLMVLKSSINLLEGLCLIGFDEWVQDHLPRSELYYLLNYCDIHINLRKVVLSTVR